MISGKPSKSQSAALLAYQLSRLKTVQHERERIPKAELTLLQRWQGQRLARSHADLLSDPRYRLAAEFFLHELYGDKDFSRRDHDVERAYPIMIRTMPAGVLHTVATAVELNALSCELDYELLRTLMTDFGLKDELTEAMYSGAYRHCNNYQRRSHQIDLIQRLGMELSRAVHHPLIYTALLLARGPAHLAGFGALHDFIEAGFHAFRHIGDPTEFLAIIVTRERRILDRIYANHPQPFAAP